MPFAPGTEPNLVLHSGFMQEQQDVQNETMPCQVFENHSIALAYGYEKKNNSEQAIGRYVYDNNIQQSV